jgi:hypothetical protein
MIAKPEAERISTEVMTARMEREVPILLDAIGKKIVDVAAAGGDIASILSADYVSSPVSYRGEYTPHKYDPHDKAAQESIDEAVRRLENLGFEAKSQPYGSMFTLGTLITVKLRSLIRLTVSTQEIERAEKHLAELKERYAKQQGGET